ncbi:sodium:proton exchanger [Streptomyces sp. R302]|uniref:cation:proton antiporter domain-containing protein n=1 Tax=unclassified Streptomyces TaxID=2593676 RepID=UPI00145F8875|nr:MULTISPECIES: cation:proton antiporter [unclassified Streptomyces]NML51375.1 sodium:proton exchanger [Streptomyces sp. R301]NML79953.1 sodium:proton exchanger [Streptomyces sp. R302]
MTFVLIVITAVTAGWALVARRLERGHVRAPVVLVLAGVVTGVFTHSRIAVTLNSEIAQHVAEVILAVLLFVDATELPGGRLFGNDPGEAARTLLVALPLSLAAVVLLGTLLLPGLPAVILLIIAGIIVPTDFAPAETLVRDTRIAARVRDVLNVESGYTDGIISPVFLFALILAGSTSQAHTPVQALATAVPFAAKALAVGVALGSLLAWLMTTADRRQWMTGQSRRVLVLVTPLLVHTVTVAAGGNGFVAAFVCGIAFRYVRQTPARRHESYVPDASDFRLVEDTGSIMAMCMWFFFGNATVLALSEGIDVPTVLLCLAALTVVRVGPILFAFLGSAFTGRERLMIGTLGPRGTTSIVFGLLAFNALPDGPSADTALYAMTVTVLGSALLHGLGSTPLARLLTAPAPAPTPAPVPASPAGPEKVR